MNTLDTNIVVLSEDATEEEFAQFMVQLRKQMKSAIIVEGCTL